MELTLTLDGDLLRATLDLSPLLNAVGASPGTLVEAAIRRTIEQATATPSAGTGDAGTSSVRVEVVQVPALALTADQAAALMNVSRRQFDSLVAAGQMPEPYYAGGQSSRWLVSELEAAFRRLPRRQHKARKGA